VLGLFAVFAIAGTVIALRARDRFGRLLAVGIVTWISSQALVNIGGVIALLPITGVPLPFMSFGGNALLINLITVGVLMNIAKSARAR
jgi:cell division protein FtsW